MTIDERIEALTHSLELLSLDVQQNTKNIDALARIASQTHEMIQRQANTMDHLIEVIGHHDSRITKLEDRQQ